MYHGIKPKPAVLCSGDWCGNGDSYFIWALSLGFRLESFWLASTEFPRASSWVHWKSGYGNTTEASFTKDGNSILLQRPALNQ